MSLEIQWNVLGNTEDVLENTGNVLDVLGNTGNRNVLDVLGNTARSVPGLSGSEHTSWIRKFLGDVLEIL